MATATKKSTTTKAEKSNGNGAEKKATDKRSDAEARRGRGELEAQVKEITDAYEADNSSVDLPEGKTLTPHMIAKLIADKTGDDAPSSGAVAAILKRWDEYGFALTHDKPLAFKRYSAKGQKEGLDALKEKHREAKKAERAAAKDEKKS